MQTNLLSQNVETISFGKYKGQPVDVLQTDPSYCDWLSAQDWFREKHSNIYNIIVNNFSEPTDTPEHNMLQAKFLDEDFAKRVIASVINKDVIPKVINYRIEDNETALKNAIHYIEKHQDNDKELIDNVNKKVKEAEKYMMSTLQEVENKNIHSLVKKYKLDFEEKGWDVVLTDICLKGLMSAEWDSKTSLIKTRKTNALSLTNSGIYIEIKPSVGDDYPSILRQMKANKESRRHSLKGAFVLMYDNFTATGVTEEELKKLFNTAGFCVRKFCNVEN